MKAILSRAIVWILVTIAAFAIWQAGVYSEALMAQKTDFYFTFHFWASLIICPLIGAVVAFRND